MKYLVALILLCLAFPAYGHGDGDVIYQIMQVHDFSDFDYGLIDEYRNSPSKWGSRENVLNLFKPTKGEHKIIVFMAATWGIGGKETTELFHEILALKVDENYVILDGLQYTLEWAEPPLALDLYRLKTKGTKLKEGLKLSNLQFQSFLDGDTPPIGVVDNVYNFQEQF